MKEREDKKMKYSIVYSSQTGNTELLAKQIKDVFQQKGDLPLYFGCPEEAKIKDESIIFVGFWTDKGECSNNITIFLESLHNKKVFLFGTAGFGGSHKYFEQIISRLEKHLDETNLVLGSWMCQGKMPPSVRKRYEAMLNENPEDEKIKNMIANFDCAMVHPNTDDLEQFANTLMSI